ncbi:type II toxin-antitoxin system VapC family toxin [Hymenobacter volaticus]|uniref:Type II toxin-antitoxin system VapC family toxin n=1 Tax=Hymenobacter volaticus TaxID=2932254 RepID=A0ABY4GC27_9BACT|nr:type II toxin-antitoxin system VapC family toxin [Hymenobacter volaticus]UOQ67974.1 type II toxin-antitoxin system VapC family toxin [Hymenobacter volaticus]
MKNCLLDTNICIYFIKGLYQLDRKIEEVGPQNCCISEMTVAELKYGVENSKTPEIMRPIVEAFIPKFAVIPVYDALDVYAAEKARLRRQGLMVDDFDILIGATAIVNNMVMVSNNYKHLSRLANIDLQDWTTAEPRR